MFPVCVCVCACVQGIPTAVADRLGDYTFDLQAITLKPHIDLHVDNQPEGLRAALQQLRALDAPNAVVNFEDWGMSLHRQDWAWSEELDQVVAEARPTLTHLEFDVPDVVPPDTPSYYEGAHTHTRTHSHNQDHLGAYTRHTVRTDDIRSL